MAAIEPAFDTLAEPQQRRLHFATAPAFFVAAAFAAGIGLAHWTYRPPAWTLLASTIAMLCLLLCPRVALWLQQTALLLAWVAAGVFCATVQRHPAPCAALQAALLDSDATHALKGRVMPSTRPRPAGDASESDRTVVPLLLALQQVDGSDVGPGDGRQLLHLSVILPSAEELRIHCGDWLEFHGKLHSPPRYFTPAAWNQAEWLAEQGVFAEGSVHAEAISVSEATQPSLGCWMAGLRNHVLDRMDALSVAMQRWPNRWQFAALQPEDVSLLASALLGDRSRLAAEDRSAFQRVGAFHLLVVSGLSIALLAGALWWLLRRLQIPALWATGATLALLTAYAELTGMDKPVQRALLMTAIYMLGRLAYRRPDPLNTLSVAALVLLGVDPAALQSTSLQMTLLAVMSLAGVASPLLERTTRPWFRASKNLSLPLDTSLPPRHAQFRVTLRLWARALRPLLGMRLSGWLPGAVVRTLIRVVELAFVSLVLELALAVPLAVDFHRVVALSVGANLLTVPLLGLLLPLAIVTALLACASTAAALPCAACTASLLHLAAGAVHHLALLPLAEWRTPPTHPLAVAAAMLCLLLAIALAHQNRGTRAALSLACLGAIGALALCPVPLRLHTGALEVTALDVGQGDAIFVASPGGRTLLVDAGGPAGPFSNSSAGDFFGEEIVSPYLWSRGIRRLDCVALTHAHSDHMGGMAAVLRNFHPRELWVGENPPVPAYLQLLDLARQLGIPVRHMHRGDSFLFGGAEVRVLSPAPDYVAAGTPSNDDSLVLHLAYGSTSALLEGDAQRQSEQAMLAAPEDAAFLASNLLKVGHHGSLSSTTEAFLEAVRPDWAVISAGRHNLFGHPRFPVVQRLDEHRVRVYRTDMDGASSFLLNGQTVVSTLP